MLSKKYKVPAFFLVVFLTLTGVTGYYQRWHTTLFFGYLAAVTDIEFYGKILDQNDDPVANAEVSYFIGGQFLAAGAGSGVAVTDENGVFFIYGEGANIVVQAITGDRIDYNSSTPDFQPLLSGGRNPDLIIWKWKEYTSDNPYVFKAWRVQEYGNVKTGRDGYPLFPDGRIYTYNGIDRKRRKRWSEVEIGNGYLRVSCDREPMADPNDYKDWRVTLAPIEGGIQKTDDIYMNIAPEGGYLDSITEGRSVQSGDYQPSLTNQRYFFTAMSGKYYGSLFVHYDPHFRNEQCNVAISYKINLDGSRNLAARP